MLETEKISPLKSLQSQTNRRRTPRYLLENKILLHSNRLGNIDGFLTDVSVGGIGILLEKSLNHGEKVSITAELGPQKVLLSTQAVVKWVNSNKFGLEFAEADNQFIEELLRSVHIGRIEQFSGCRLPENIKARYINDWVHKMYNEEEISQIIDFERPFLKIEKVITFDTYENGNFVTKKSLSMGKLYEEDVKGHYNNTIFLALCGQLMGQAASILLAALNPGTAPQIIEVENVKPSMIKDQVIWKPRKTGSPFFVEIELKRKKLSLFMVDTRISFGDLVMGMTNGMKLFLTPKESIWEAETLPPWI